MLVSLLRQNIKYRSFFQKPEKTAKNSLCSPSESQEIEPIVQINLQICSICFDEKQSGMGKLSHQLGILFFDAIALLQYDAHICWTKNVDNFLKKYLCRNCDKFWSRSFNFERHIRSCAELISHRYPTGPYDLKGIVFEKMRNLDIEVEN